MLQNTRYLDGCSDGRDLLYAKIALASDAALLIPRISYDTSVEQVYREFAALRILENGSLRVITFAHRT